jgi:hypothetical protein
MKKLLVRVLALSTLMGILFISACTEDETPATETPIEDNNTSMNESDDMLSISEDAMIANGTAMQRTDGAEAVSVACGTVSIVVQKTTTTYGKIKIE